MAKDVTFQRSEYEAALPDWALVADVCAGQRAVKNKGKDYLPDPNKTDDGPWEKDAVYKRYKERASFYNATGKTLSNLVGAVFGKPATVTLPASMDYMLEDADGAGVSVQQQSRSVLADVMKKGRHGLLVDYPRTDAPASRADQLAGNVRATIVSVDAEQIVNWKTTKVGGSHMLSLLVIHEYAQEDTEDGFGLGQVEQYRVLRLSRLDSGGMAYTVELWRQNENKDWYLFEGPFFVTDGRGQAWDVIPFTFVGAENNDHQVDKAPLLDLAQINIKHYQVGADWYNALHYAGQPQPVMAGLTQGWVEMLEKKGIVLGSRAPLMLPENGSFEFATVTAETAIQKELQDLEQRMIGLGARLITPGEAVKTATEAQGENEANHSPLSLAATNVSSAYRQALDWAARFNNVDGKMEFELSQDFTEQAISPDMARAIIELWQSGTIPQADAIDYLRSRGLVNSEKTNEQVIEELDTAAGGLGLDGGT